MNLAKLAIKHPALIVSIMLAMVAVGLASFKAMGVDLFPSTSIPIISVITVYPGAGPSEIETLVSRPLEEKIAAISGLKRLSSKNLEGVSILTAEFHMGMNTDKLEQEVRDKVNMSRGDLPREVEEPLIRHYDPADQPVMELTLKADMKPGELYDLADQVIRPRLEQVNSVAAVQIYGGRKREIQVLLDRGKLAQKEIPVVQVAAQIGASGENIPSGKVDQGLREMAFRGMGEFKSVSQVSEVLVNLYGNERPTKIGEVGQVVDTLADEKSRTYVDGKPVLFLYIYRQAGTNIVDMANGVKKVMGSLNQTFEKQKTPASLGVLVDSSEYVNENVSDVYETILLSILLTMLVIYLFLGNVRAMLITAVVLPVSLIGAFALMGVSGFTINVISLIALSLGVGLLVDDAIVVIENIFRRMEEGESPLHAAEHGTNQIQVSVFAITLVVISIFVPVAFMGGLVGQFLRQFGLTLVFAMAISFFVALTLIPMLTGYFADGREMDKKPRWPWITRLRAPVRAFDHVQTWMEGAYSKLLGGILRKPMVPILISLGVFVLSMTAAHRVPQAFAPDLDHGQALVDLEMAPGTNLDGTQLVAQQVEAVIKKNANVDMVALTVGGSNGEANKAQLFVQLKGGDRRGGTTNQFCDKLRGQLAPFAQALPKVKAFDPSGGLAGQPFVLNLIGSDAAQLEAYAAQLKAHLAQDARVKDMDTTLRPGKPEFRVQLKEKEADAFGVNSKTVDMELRAMVEGFTPAKFRENGKEYDIRVRLQPDQRDLEKDYSQVLVPNVNHRLVRLSDVALAEEAPGAAEIDRQDRGRQIQITASVAPGVGVGDVVADVERYMASGPGKLPDSVRADWGGDAENMKETNSSAVVAIAFGIIFIYLILSSLYGSFATPMTILVALPLALSGAFIILFALGNILNVFTILGIFFLLGIAGKNSILLVGFANQLIAEGLTPSEAIFKAGRVRLRPILMTSFALIAGTLPVALGMSEAAKMRTSMGMAIVGGIISETLLTLVVVPAIFVYVDRYRLWSKAALAKIFMPK